MPLSKASKIWNKLSRSLSVIYVIRPVCLRLNPPFICMHIRVVKSCQIRHPEVRIRYPDTSEGSHRIASYI